MSRPRRLLLRATSLITIAALLFSLVGLSWAAAPLPVGYMGDVTLNAGAYYSLDETSGNRLDSTGNGNTLTPQNSPTYITGKVGNALHLTRASTQALVNAIGDTNSFTTTFEIAAWVYLDSTPADQMQIASRWSFGGGGSKEYFLAWNANKFRIGISADGTTNSVILDTTSTYGAGAWYWVDAWFDDAGNQVGISVNNGTPVTTTYTGGVKCCTSSFRVGFQEFSPAYQFWDGAIDELGFWKRLLTPTERTALYNAGAGCAWPCDAATPTPTTTRTSTPVVSTGNVIRNWDFSTPPRVSQSYWSAMNRVVQQVPASNLGEPEMWDGIEVGSCGPEYWSMSRTGGTDGRIYQDFGWTGGPMYINFEAVTNNHITRGEVSILDKLTGEEEFAATFTNGSGTWQTFKFLTGSQPAGQYRIGFSYDGFGSEVGLGLDNVNVRGGYWGHNCPAGQYNGQMPINNNATAVFFASPTPPPYISNTPINTNCGFEQGWAGYSHNAGARLFYTGGATGPTYAYLHTVYDNGSDPQSVDIPGSLGLPFSWPGGQMMYVSYFTGPGTRARVTLRNHFTGYSRELQSPNSEQSFGGWVKRSAGFNVPVAGNYVLEFSSPWGQIAALDGIAVSTGGFASGPCSNSNTNSDNNATATQHIANTSVAATATNQPAVILTSYAVGTNQAAAYATYLAGQYATMTQNAGATQTARPPAGTATQSARLTATAQGTPVAPTRTPPPQPSPWPGGGVCVLDPLTMEWVCPPPAPITVVPPDTSDLTAAAATQTAWAAAQATFWAGAQATANARATGTQAAQQTQGAAAAAQQTQAAAIQQTAVARAQQTESAALRATQTAIVEGINALATANAAATQHAQQAAATQTAQAQQTAASGGNSTQQAEATNTAVAYATQYAGVTQTAVAQLTADSVTRAAATATAVALATQNQAATAVVLATQQGQQQQATATAVAQQTQLAATANPTAYAQATTTAQAYATTYAQVTATAQAQATSHSATQQANATQAPGGGDLPPVDDRPEPGPAADCIRPSSPLQVANWIDYEVCRILTWFAWSPSNTDQLMEIDAIAANHVPWGILSEMGEGMGVFISWLGALNWCDTGFCQDTPMAPLNLEASGILTGNWDFDEGTPYYSDQCTILMGPLLGPYIQSGACFCVNVLCALGVLPIAQLIFNAVFLFILVVYIKNTWMTAAHT